MDEKKLLELAERYQRKADTAFQNYQETGITRYDTARRNNEDMAEALRMAASAKEDHDRMIHLRGGSANWRGGLRRQTVPAKRIGLGRCRRCSENCCLRPVCKA